MAELSFVYGTMESGKTTKLLQDNYNYIKHGHKVIIVKPQLDTKGGMTVVNRTCNSAKVDIALDTNDSLLDLEHLRQIIGSKALLVDEVQFLSYDQIKELWEIAHILDIQVICYGLKTDFRGIPFSGSIALFGLADHTTELTVRCECGEIANFNARIVDGDYTVDGDVVAIDGQHNVIYQPLCSKCYLEKVVDKNRKEFILERKRLAKDDD